MFCALWIAVSVILLYIGMRRVFVFFKVEKYKRRYFFYFSLGAIFAFPVIRLCIVMKVKKDGTRRIMIVKRAGKTRVIMDLAKMGRFDPDIGKIVLPAVFAEKIKAEIKIGLPNAKDTCLLCAFISALIHCLLPLAKGHIRLDRTDVRVTPLFKNESFEGRADCILKIDSVHIIYRLIRWFIGKRGVKKEKAVLKNASN